MLDRLDPRNVERIGDEMRVVRQLLSGTLIAVSMISMNAKPRPVARGHLSLNRPVHADLH